MSPLQANASASEDSRGDQNSREPPAIELQDSRISSRTFPQTQDHPSQYSVPDDWDNLDEIASTSPVENVTEANVYRHRSLDQVRSENPGELPAIELHSAKTFPQTPGHTARRPSQYSVPDHWANLDEIASTSPVENVTEANVYRHRSLDQVRTRETERRSSLRRDSRTLPQPGGILEGEAKPEVSKFATQVLTHSYLIFFAILGTLARAGLSALTTYPGAPVIFSVLWPNFGGSLVMGYLIEDRNLFRLEANGSIANKTDEENGSGSDPPADLADAKKAHMAVKKTIPLYIGLATGFCGSFTSFSSFIADAFLAISNNLVTPGGPDPPHRRNGGYSFMALLAVVLVTVSLSLAGLFVGAHLAIALEPFTVTIRYPFTRRILDPLVVFLGWGSWLGAVLLAIFPPHDFWRGRVVFALVFAPLGCLARFYLSLYLNGKVASFPVGTFAANVSGTVILGMAWDIAHVPIGGEIGCQVLSGIETGFCGCLTTVSTWVAELSSLRRKHAYIYGTASVVSALVLMIAIMGGLRWSEGFSGLMCST